MFSKLSQYLELGETDLAALLALFFLKSSTTIHNIVIATVHNSNTFYQ